jgi:outer membrane protein assembly factor BamB
MVRTLLLACAFGTAASALAADWPAFRGPNRDGNSAETGLLKKWPDGGPKLLATYRNLGLGWGTPSVAEGHIFGIGTRDGKDGVWALAEADGKEKWFAPIADAAGRLAKQTNGPASTPTFHKGKVFAVSANGTLAAIDAKTGKVAWSKSYTKDFGGSVPTWAFTESVYADGDVIVCTPGGKDSAVVALKAETGAVVWKTALNVGGGYGYSSPIKATIHDVPQYLILTGTAGGVIGVEAASGKLLWQYNGLGASGGVAQIPMPLVKGNKVWVSCSYDKGGSALLEIAKNDGKFSAKAVKTHQKKELNNHHGGMVLVGDYVYFGHEQNQGQPVCVDINTGEIKWGPEKPPAGGSGSAATISADGRLYFRYQSGTVVLIEPSAEQLKVVSSFKLPVPDVKSYPQSWPHPVIANGKLYIRDQNVMYVYDVKAGAGN